MNADGAALDAEEGNEGEGYETKSMMKHWSVNHTTLPGLLLDIYENGGSSQLSGDEIAETFLGLLRRKFVVKTLC